MGDPRLSGSAQTLDRWFNTCTLLTNGTRANCVSASEPIAWIQPGPGQVLNNSTLFPNLRSYAKPQMNMSLFKRIPIRDRVQLELRGEAFNATNTPIYGMPTANLTSPTFGAITHDQINLPRYVQLAMKVIF